MWNCPENNDRDDRAWAAQPGKACPAPWHKHKPHKAFDIGHFVNYMCNDAISGSLGNVAMTEQSNCLLSRCRLFSKSAGFVAGLVGSLVLVGWLFDCAVLKSVFPSMVPMNPATAVNFILAGLALWLLHSADRHSRARRIGCWMGLLVATMGLIKLGDHFNLFAIRIDQVLFAVKSGNNLMSPNTALAFVFVGFALGGLDVETRRGNCPAEGFALFTAFLALLALLGYVHGVQSLSAFGTFFPMALPTAATFLFISLGILGARPDRGLMRTFTGADAGGMVVRRLLPATIAIICLVNWLQLEGARHELYTNEFGDALKSAVNVALFSLLIWCNAKVLQRVDAERRLAEEKLRRSEESLGVTLYSIGDAVLATDTRGCVTRMNPVAEKLTGWAQAEAVGHPIAEVFCIINEETCQPAVIPVEKDWQAAMSTDWPITPSSSHAMGCGTPSLTARRPFTTRRARFSAWCSSFGT